MKKRILSIFQQQDEKPDAIIIKNSNEPFIDLNFFYVTGLEEGLFEGCAAILFPDGDMDLIVSELEAESAKKAQANLRVYSSFEDLEKHLKDSLKNINVLGLNFSEITHSFYLDLKKNFDNLRFIDTSEVFDFARVIKDEQEINYIKKVAKMADSVVNNIPDMIHDRLSEYELAAEINYELQKNGADKPAFDTISSFGRNSAKPHYTHGESIIKQGDFIICDFGANYKRYNSDITRTFIYKKSTEKQKKIHETVLNAQNEALNALSPGIKANKIHRIVEDYINRSEFKGHFIHSTGHSLGLAVHDPGIRINSECELELQENMVITIEPGIYIPGLGGLRIEDDILITRNGYKPLTKSSKHLMQI